MILTSLSIIIKHNTYCEDGLNYLVETICKLDYLKELRLDISNTSIGNNCVYILSKLLKHPYVK